MDDLHSPANMKTASALALEERRKKGRVRHLPHQTAALNEVFERTDHPSLQERTTLSKRLGMEVKVVNSWFQNKRAALRKKAEREAGVSTPVPLGPRASEPYALPADESLPPRSHHPSLPPISALLSRSSGNISSGDESDLDDDDLPPVLPPIQFARGTAFTEPDYRAELRMGQESPLSLSASRGLAHHTTRSVSAPFHAPPPGPVLPHKRSLNEEDFPSRHAFPPSSSLHPSLRLPYPGPPMHSHGLPEPTFTDPARYRGPPSYGRGTSDGSQTPSSVYADDLIHRDLPPLHQFGRTADDEISYHQHKHDEGHLVDSWRVPQDSLSQGSYKMRKRPSTSQLEELRRVYEANPHPSREERARLAEETGLKPQSVTNWFQNQRSLAKRRRGGPALSDSLSMHSRDSPLPSPLEPSMRGLGLTVPGTGARPRRARPEPHQLEALRRLYEQTTSPSIEQRGALALEVGMEVAKVTNWFRNLRQTAKKRARAGDAARRSATAVGDEEDVDMDAEDEAGSRGSTSVPGSRDASVVPFSRDVTPARTFASPVESVDYHMHAAEDHDEASHETGSDEDEAVTPSPHVASSPLPAVAGLRHESPVAKPYSSPSSEDAMKNAAASVADAELLLGLRNRTSPQ